MCPSIDLPALITTDARAHGVATLLDHVLDTTLALTEADAGGIQLLNAEGDLEVVAHRGFAREWIERWRRIPAGQGASGAALREGERVTLEDIEQHAALSGTPLLEDLRSAGMRAVQATPIRDDDGALVGVLSTHYRTPRAFDARSLRVLDQLSAHCAAVMAHGRADRRSAEEFRAAIESTQDGFWIVDRQGRILAVNDRYAERSGFSRDELVRMRVSDLEAPETEEAVLQHQDQIRSSGSGVYETRHRTKSGSTWPVEVNTVFRPDGDGRLFVFLRDITARKRLEHRLRTDEARLRAFVEQVPFAMVMLDRDMRYLAVSRRWREDFGLEDRPLIGESHYVVFPEIEERWRAIHRRALAGEAASADADRFIRDDGRTHWLRWKVQPWRTPEAVVGGLLIFSEDVTARVQAAEALQASEERLRRAQDGASVGTWEWNLADGSARWSDQTFHLYGFDTGSVTPSYAAWLESVHPEDRDAAAAGVADALARSAPIELEWRTTSQDRWLLCRGQPSFDSQGRVETYLGIVIDITARKQAQLTLERNRNLLADAQNLAHLGTFTYDVESGETQWSAEQFRIHGLDPAAGPPSLTDLFARLIAPEDVASLEAEILECMRQGQGFDREHRIVRPDGELRWVRTRAAPEFDTQGKLRHYLGTTLDISELREAESRARDRLDEAARLQRLNTADELASVLAHELNHPLGAIAIHAEIATGLLQSTAPDRTALIDTLQKIQGQTRRAADIVRHMRRYITHEGFITEAVDLNAVARDAGAMMERSARLRNIRLVLELAPDLPPVIGIDVQIEQVLLNLIRNAQEAITGAGAGSGEIRLLTRADDSRARVTIMDNGPGLTEAQISTLFGARPSGKSRGLGLGLRISRSLPEAHGGALWFEPHAPGAIVHLELPLA